MRWRSGLLLLCAALWAGGGRAEGGDREPNPAAGPTEAGGTGGQPGGAGETAAGGTSAATNGGGASAGAEVCFDTPRDAEAAAINAETLEMMALTPPSRLVPVSINLVPVDFDFSPESTGKKREQLIAERKQQLEPYQAPVLERLAQLEATRVSSAWLVNSVSATLSARDVPAVLCWPNVVSVQVEAAFWTIAEPPWSAPTVGSAQCPLQNGACPEHCFAITAAPVVDHVACSCTARPVTCSRQPYGIDDDEPSCRRSTETGETLIFRGLVPDPPDYRGFGPCSNVVWEYREDCSGRLCFE